MGSSISHRAWWWGLVLLLVGQVGPLQSVDRDLYRFFAEEAQVVSAGRLPRSLYQVPATVYVIPGREVQTSGTPFLWEALRRLPGVEVMAARAYQGEVSIRGLGKPFNNRTLVLLDGRTLLNTFFDFAIWETIPVTAGEIERIEVVEGPTSALYGANAINGVINIITKTPEQLGGGLVGLNLSEGGSRSGQLLYGIRGARVGYKLGANWRRGYQFENPDQHASKVAEVHGQVEWNPRRGARLNLTGGAGRTRTELTSGATGTTRPSFTAGFLRLDGTRRQVQVGAFLNWGKGEFDQFGLLNNPKVEYRTAELSAERRFDLPAGNQMVAGGSFRHVYMQSETFGEGSATHSLGSVFFEDEWRVTRRLNLVFSGRLDHQELAGTAFSPRLSAVYTPRTGQIFRAAVGTAYRNPNLNENFLALEQDLPAPAFLPANSGFTGMEVNISGSRTLKQERILLFELAHRGQFGAWETTVAGFHYRLEGLVGIDTRIAQIAPPVFVVENTFANRGRASAWGGEAGVTWRRGQALVLAGNYSYLYMTGEGDLLAARRGSPTHKLNGGAQIFRGALAANLWGHYVGPTWWAQNLSGFPGPDGKVPAYVLVQAGLSYRLAGPLAGTELGLGAFNLLDHAHYQLLPYTDQNVPGQYGERLGRRLTLSLTQRF